MLVDLGRTSVGVLLAGGRGTRLAPLTSTLPKQLLPAANQPILERILLQLAGAGLREVVVVLGDRGERIRAAIDDGRAFGLAVQYVEQPGPLGIGDAVRRCRPIIGDRRFCVVLGDCMFQHDLAKDLRDTSIRREEARLLVTHVDASEHYGIVETDERGLVARVMEKPPDYGPGLAIIGVYLFDHRLFTALEDLSPSARGEVELTDAIARLIDAGHDVRASVIDGAWVDTGTLHGALEANRVAIDGRDLQIAGTIDRCTLAGHHVGVDEGALVTQAIIRDHVVIGAGAVVDGGEVGDNVSIGAGCRLVRCTVRDAIVMPDVVATDCTIIGSIVGTGARISSDVIGRIVAERDAVKGTG